MEFRQSSWRSTGGTSSTKVSCRISSSW
jgi:hypothetical protein